ncbi:hypothetical protein OROGR_004132 [Orobanche gracilis]
MLGTHDQENSVQEAVDLAVYPYLRSSENQVCLSLPRRLQLQFCSKLPHTLFTNSRVLSEDRGPVTIVLCDSISKEIITSGPLSSLKVTIVVLDGDFGHDDLEDWTPEEFDRKLVKNREGKRPLVTGELTVVLQNGVGNIGEISFTDNSSWIRSGKFRLGAKIHNKPAEVSGIKEAMSNAFKIKDHRGESYQKHHPPSLDDEVWRLEKIAKDGPSHKKLNQYGIFRVRDFLRLYFTDQSTLRVILHKATNKTWETIMGHAQSCMLDDKKYMYRTAQGTGLIFNSIYKVVGVTLDGHNYLSPNCLDTYQMNMVEHLKQQAYKNLPHWDTVCNPSIVGYPMILESPSPDSLTNPNLDLHGVNLQEQEMNSYPPTMSSQSKTEVEQANCLFELGEGSTSVQGFDPIFKIGVGTSYSPGEFYMGEHPSWESGGNNYVMPQHDLPVDETFQVVSPAWQGNGLLIDPGNHETGIISSNSGILIPRNGRPKARWCKVLAVVKWRILVRRNVAEKKWRRSFSYV